MRRHRAYRRPRIHLAVIVMLMVAMVVGAGQAGAAPSSGRLTMANSPATVLLNDETTVTGSLTDATGRPVAHAQIQFLRKLLGTSGWSWVAIATTDSAGRYVAKVRLPQSGDIKATYSSSTLTATSAVTRVMATPQILSSSLSATSYHLQYSATLRAGAQGQIAVPQILVGSTWVSQAHVTVPNSLRVSYSAVGTPGTSYQIRWLVGTLPNTQQVAGAAQKVSVPVISNSVSQFTMAAYPDTQQEVLNNNPAVTPATGDQRYLNRAKYLVANKSLMNLQFLFSVGDNANWDNVAGETYNGVAKPAHWQYQVLANGTAPLEKAGIPYSLAVGNHDSEATASAQYAGRAGSCRLVAATGKCSNTYNYQRDTTTINSYFKAADFGKVGGAFEAGKVDNVWSEFTSGGKKWMVLSLELWPRQAAVAWAAAVIKSHPHDNVVITTHSYLSATCTIQDSKTSVTANGQAYQYGSSSPEYLWQNLVYPYANVRVVVSGHVGTSCSRTDTGKNGNKIVSLLNCFHSNTSNPIRFLTFDTAANTLSTYIYGPGPTTTSYPPTVTFSNMHWAS